MANLDECCGDGDGGWLWRWRWKMAAARVAVDDEDGGLGDVLLFLALAPSRYL